MKTASIICSGEELEGVLTDISARRFAVESLDTMVKTNAGYRVNYFESGPEKGPVVASSDDESVACAGKDCSEQEPSALNPFPHQCETPATPAAPEAVKGAVAPRNQVIGVQIPVTPSLAQRSCVTSHQEWNGGAEAVGVGLSIETRMAELQEKLAAAGKIKRRKQREARLPYATD